MAPQSGLPMIEERTEKYVAFVSGLNLGETGPRQKMELDLLVQYLKGQLENGTDRSHRLPLIDPTAFNSFFRDRAYRCLRRPRWKK